MKNYNSKKFKKMKKYFSLLFAALLAFTFISCDDDDNNPNVDNDTYSVVYDATGSFTATDDYTLIFDFPQTLYSTDVVLVYRRTGTDGGNPIWQQIPRTLFLDEGELDYDFDFSVNNAQIYAGGGIDFAAQSSTFANNYLNNQTFRIVLVPADPGTGKKAVDYSNYDEVIKRYGIDDSKVTVLK